MKKSLLLIALFFAVLTSEAQINNEQVILKNGTQYQGVISEIIPDSIVVIKLVDGRIMTINYDQILRIKNQNEKILSPTENNYYVKSTLGLMMGQGQREIQKNFLFETTGGYQYKQWQMGAGSGVHVLYGTMYLPAIAEVSYSFGDKITQPYITLQGGGVFNLSYNKNNTNFWNHQGYKNGKFIGSNFGLRHYVSNNLALVFEAGYRFYHLQGKLIETYYPPNLDILYYPAEYNADLHRFSLKFGLEF